MFTLHIEAHSIPELKRKALAAFGEPEQTEMNFDEVTVVAGKPIAVKDPEGLLKKPVAKGAKAKAAAAAVEEAQEAATVSEPVEAREELTTASCKELLKKIITLKGMDYATQFILNFGIKKITDLKPAQFEEFTLKAKAELP